MMGAGISRTALVFLVVFVVSVSPCLMYGHDTEGAVTWDGSADTSWYSDGESSFTIKNPSQLAGLAELVNSGTHFEGKRIVLGSNIDLGGRPWTPIGTGESTGYIPVSFRGEFDGSFHTVSGLSVTGSIKNAGLFGYIYEADVANLSVSGAVDVSINGGVPYAGGITGSSYGSFIEDCHSSVAVTAASVRDSSSIAVAGGIVGKSSNDNIVNCYNTGAVHADIVVEKSIGGSGTARSGGIAGYLEAPSNIFNCYSSGMVTSSADGRGANRTSGAIIGDASVVDINGCYFLTGTEGNDSYPNRITDGEFGADGRTFEEAIVRGLDSIICRGYVVLDLLNQYADSFNGYDLADWYTGDDGLPCHRYSGGQSVTDPEEPIDPEEPTDPEEPDPEEPEVPEFVPEVFEVGDFRYSTREDGNLTLSWYFGNDTDPEIPGTVTYEGKEYKVTELGPGCFTRNGEVVTLPETFETLSRWSFSDSDVREVNLPASINVTEGLFIENLELLTVDPANPYITVVDNVIYSKDMTVLIAYPYTGPTDAVTIPGVKSIGDFAFYRVPVESVRFGEGVETIGSMIFMDCTELREIHLPSTMRYKANLVTATGLENIYVSEDNPELKSVDGILFTKDGKTLMLYPTGRSGSYNVPEGVTNLESYSFRDGCLTTVNLSSTVEYVGGNAFYSDAITNILVNPGNEHYMSVDGVLFSIDGKELVAFPSAREGNYDIPYGTEVVGSSAFYECNLDSVIIPSTVTIIDDLAFSYSPNLERVEFESSDAKIGFRAFELTSYNPKTCWIVAPDGFMLPEESIGNGYTTFIYGEKPNGGNDTVFGESNSLVLIAVIAAIVIALVAVVILRHR